MRHKSLAAERPELIQQWSPENQFSADEISACSHKKAIWVCNKGHRWEAVVKNRVLTGSNCPYCAHRKLLKGFNDFESAFPKIACEWSNKNLPLKPSDVMAFSNTKAWWKCKNGHEWYALISSRSGGHGCPYCCKNKK